MTLAELIGDRQRFINAVEARATEVRPMYGAMKDVRMDGVLVISDEVARRFLEIVYVQNTHFIPFGLPGVGMATGDVLEHEQHEHLFLHIGVMFGNVDMLHFFRKYEPRFQEWEKVREGLDDRVKAFIKALTEFDPKLLGLPAFAKPERWAFGRAGSAWVGTPLPGFVTALERAAKILRAKKKKGTSALARTAFELFNATRQFAGLAKSIKELRDKLDHKGAPYIDPSGLIHLSSPKASGLASLHNKGFNDDPFYSLPGVSDLMIIAGQAPGNEQGIPHFGGGMVRGEHFIMSIPFTPFFGSVQQLVDNDPGLVEEWAQAKKLKGQDWPKTIRVWQQRTKPFKDQVLLQAMPELISNQVLGFNVNMLGEEVGVIFLRPIVTESALQGSEELLEASGLKIIRRGFVEPVLLSDSKAYYTIPSIFDPPKVVETAEQAAG